MKHVITLILLVLIFAPVPSPDVAPVPPEPVTPTADLWDSASDVYRTLTSDVFDEYSSKTFNNDDEKLKFIVEHTEAARKAAYTDVNQRIQSAVKDSKTKEFADALRKKELK